MKDIVQGQHTPKPRVLVCGLFSFLAMTIQLSFVCFYGQANAQTSSANASVRASAEEEMASRQSLLHRLLLDHRRQMSPELWDDIASVPRWRNFGSRIDAVYPLPRVDSQFLVGQAGAQDRERLEGLRNPLDRTAEPRANFRQKLLSKGVSIAAADTIREAWVTHYASGLAPAYDGATGIVVDGEGNVCVTGYSTAGQFGLDYYTVKYSSLGEVLWSVRYDGGGDDAALAIATDGSGNVYVTGYSLGSGTDYDYATVKYSASGVQQWVARYNGPGNDFDRATAIAIDHLGNVYVTGRSYRPGACSDYATIKYDSSGKEEWVARYNGKGNGYDFAAAIAVDALGNVYVTGTTSSDTCSDYATIKYNTHGNEEWVARCHESGTSYVGASAIAVESAGNVYVTGTDYATIKYSASGAEKWNARYEGPMNSDYATAIAIDGAGNVYVTGTSFGNEADYATIKYDSSGAKQWVARYDGSAYDWDEAKAIAIDDSGNVYVTGRSYSSPFTGYDYATIKYNASGIQEWISRYNGPRNGGDFATAIAVDGSGSVFVTGCSIAPTTSSDYATIKYSSSGVQQWVACHNGSANSDDHATAITTDRAGNIYVTGYSRARDVYYDYATIKYNSSGTQQWVARYNGPGDFDDIPTAIAVDGGGNVYVTGYSWGSGNTFYENDYATIKYNSVGTQQWVARYNGPRNFDDLATAIAVDDSGNVYVTGSSDNSDEFSWYATIKYNSSGTQQWVARYNGKGSGFDHATAMTVDASGNVYVTGGSLGLYSDYATIKYNTSGSEQWVARYVGPMNCTAVAKAIAVDGSGNVYVTGSSYNPSTSTDYATIKYNSSGTQQWVARYNGPGNSSDRVSAIAIDGSGNVYVTGGSYSSFVYSEYATVKYSASGTEEWIARYNGTGNAVDQAAAIALDSSGNIYVTGFSWGLGNTSYDYDYATLKYNASGTEEWVARYKGPGGTGDYATAMAVDGSGNVYVTGGSTGSGWSTYTTIKYAQTTTSVVAKNLSMPASFVLEQNFPNPFNPSTTIRFAVPISAHCRLRIFNLLGQEISTLVEETKAPGSYSVMWDAANKPSGVYLYRLEAGQFSETRKLIVLR